ncbi:MAG: DUF2461 domain-containing protein [Saprospiraceae bacterium]
MLHPDFLEFLKDLTNNNQRDWFHANKKRYEKTLKEPFKELVQTLIKGTQKFDPTVQIEPKDAIFRINRDIRFSADKSPYKTHVSALISKGGRRDKTLPGYYLQIGQGSLMIGGGAYFLEKEMLQKVRTHILQNPSVIGKIEKSKAFTEKFGEIKGDKNKRYDKSFMAIADQQPLIANKQFYFMAELDPKLVLEKDFVKMVLSYFKTGKRLNDFIIEALA